MGQTEDDIKAAKNIGAMWLVKDNEYRKKLLGLKKVLVNRAKTGLRTVDAAVQKGEHLDPRNAEVLSAEVQAFTERLTEYTKQGSLIMAEHHKWTLREPRKDLEFIRTQLRLGPHSGDRYKAVAAALKHQLVDIGKELSATEDVWADIKYQIDNQLKVAKRLREVIEDGVAGNKAYVDQFKAQTKQFVERAASEIGELKIPAAAKDLSDMQRGHTYADQARDGKLHTYQNRLATIAKVEQAIEKNYQRVLKTVPKNVLDSVPMGAAVATIENQRARFKRELDEARGLLEKVIAQLKP